MKKVELSVVEELIGIKLQEEELESQFSILRRNRAQKADFDALNERYSEVCSKRSEFISSRKLPGYFHSIKAGNLAAKLRWCTVSSDGFVTL